MLTQGISLCNDDPILAYNFSCYHSLAGDVPAIEYLTERFPLMIASDRSGCESDFPIRFVMTRDLLIDWATCITMNTILHER